MDNKAIVILKAADGISKDLEIPLNITIADLLSALNNIYNLSLSKEQLQTAYLKAENPVALLCGDRLLSEYGIHDGTIISLTL